MESFENEHAETEIARQQDRNTLQQRMHEASDRMHTASDRMQQASDNARRVIQHQRPADGKSEWTDVPPEKRTILQKVAAYTFGVATAGNGVTINSIRHGIKTAQCIAGQDYIGAAKEARKWRFPDMYDGLVAHITKTKGPVGAALDAGGDNATMLPVFGLLAYQSKIPTDVAGTIIFQRLQTLYENTRMRALGESTNPNMSAKLAMTYASLYIGGILKRESHGQRGNIFRKAAYNLGATVMAEMAILKGHQGVAEYHQKRLALEATFSPTKQ